MCIRDRLMEISPKSRETPVREHFANCEYRQLFKRFAMNYSQLMRKASDEVMFIAQEMHDYLKSMKIYRNIHFGIIKYKYSGHRILDYTLHGSEYPYMRINIGTCVDFRDTGDIYFKLLNMTDKRTQSLFYKSLLNCDLCRPACEYDRIPVKINGKEINVCGNIKLRINPRMDDIPQLFELISLRKDSIDEYLKKTHSN